MDYLRLYKNIYDPTILLLHKGSISFDLISIILDSLEEAVQNLEEDKKVRKKFNQTLVESFQNLGHHATKEPHLLNSEMIMVVSRKYFYKIITGNLIENDAVGDMRKNLEEINSMDAQQLRAYYKQVMSETGFSDKGTAGLGFIDMARKTGQKLVYEFYKMDDKYSYFSFEVKIKKNQS
ncbi:MAG TPA: SiaB family protein kinase [Cyclobacteriaceae bacterium]